MFITIGKYYFTVATFVRRHIISSIVILFKFHLGFKSCITAEFCNFLIHQTVLIFAFTHSNITSTLLIIIKHFIVLLFCESTIGHPYNTVAKVMPRYLILSTSNAALTHNWAFRLHAPVLIYIKLPVIRLMVVGSKIITSCPTLPAPTGAIYWLVTSSNL